MNKATSEPRRRSVRDYLRVLFRRKTLFLVSLTAIFLGGLLVSIRLPKTYTAEATIQRKTNNWIAPDDQASPTQKLWPELPEQEARQLITSNAVIEQGLRRAGLYKAGEGAQARRQRAALAERVRRCTQVHVVGDFIRIRFAGTNAQQTAAIANGMAVAFIEHVIGEVQEQTRQAYQQAAESADAAQKTLAQKQNARDAFRAGNADALATDAATVYAQWQKVKQNLKDADEQMVGLRASRDVLAKRAAQLPRTQVTTRRFIINPAHKRLSGRMEELKSKRDELMLTRTELHPEVRGVLRSIALVEAELKETPREVPDQREERTNTERDVVLNKIVDIDAKLEGLRVVQTRRRQEVGQFQARLQKQRHVDAERQQYAAAVEKAEADVARRQQNRLRAQEAMTVAMGQRGFSLRVWEPAQVPQRANGPKLFAYAMLSLVVGLCIAMGLVFFAEVNDSSFRSFDDASRYLQVPVVGAIAMIETEADRRWRQIRGQVLAVLGTLLCAAAAVTLLLVLILSIHSPRFFEAFLEDPIAGTGRAYTWVFHLLGM